MTTPTSNDVKNFSGRTAQELLQTEQKQAGRSVWCVASRQDVDFNLASTGYPRSLINFREGDVIETLKDNPPDRIAVLRLDTDWYESTAAELEALYPRLVPGSVCILDDYGYWWGAQKAVDEYFTTNRVHVLTLPIDYTGRIFVNPEAFQ